MAAVERRTHCDESTVVGATCLNTEAQVLQVLQVQHGTEGAAASTVGTRCVLRHVTLRGGAKNYGLSYSTCIIPHPALKKSLRDECGMK